MDSKLDERKAGASHPSNASLLHQPIIKPKDAPSPSNSHPLSETTKTSSGHTHSSDPATTSSHNNPPWRSGKDSQSRRRTRLIYLLGSNIHNRSAYQLRRYKSLEMPTVFQQHARYSSNLSTCRAIPAAHTGRSAILTTSQRSSQSHHWAAQLNTDWMQYAPPPTRNPPVPITEDVKDGGSAKKKDNFNTGCWWGNTRVTRDPWTWVLCCCCCCCGN